MGKSLGKNSCPGDGNLILNIGAFRSFTESINFFSLTNYVHMFEGPVKVKVCLFFSAS